MSLADLFKRTPDTLPKALKARLLARIGEEEHPAQKKKNADGGPFLEDWSEGTSRIISSARFSYDGTRIVTLGTSGFQYWDAKTAALHETISLPEVRGTLKTATQGLRITRSQIDISPDRQSFASFGTQPRPGTDHNEYWSVVDRRSEPDSPVALPGWNEENMLEGIRFLPCSNRLLRWGYSGAERDRCTQLDLIATDGNTVVDTRRLHRAADIGYVSTEGCAFVGWNEGVMALDCSSDKLAPICQLDLPSAGPFGTGHGHFGLMTPDRNLWIVRSRSEGERTAFYRGTLSAWNPDTKQNIWSLEMSALSPLWRQISSISIHPNGKLLAAGVVESEAVVGKFHRLASHVLLINISDGKPLGYFKAHRNTCAAYFSSDGERILTVSGGECAMNLWAV